MSTLLVAAAVPSFAGSPPATRAASQPTTSGAAEETEQAEEAKENPARDRVADVVAAVGGLERLLELEDVQYTYTYRDAAGTADISTERYRFEGELSWAEYTTHNKSVLPDREGTVVQGYDGKQTWVTLDGKPLADPKAVKTADFLRKTNYYWFAMMHKLLDPGLTYSFEGKREVDGVPYDLVRVGFEPGVGDVADTYLLYINPSTDLVDRFLFTVMDFGMADPHLMTVEYKTVSGVKLPVTRRYASANWYGDATSDEWTEELMTDIRFGNGFELELFQAPQ